MNSKIVMPNKQINQIYSNFIEKLNALKQKQNKIIDDFIKQINELKLRAIRGRIAKS